MSTIRLREALTFSLILSKLQKIEKQNVGEVLKLLEERFGLTLLEKIDHFIKKMKTEFKVSKDDNEQSWWDKCDTFLTDFKN